MSIAPTLSLGVNLPNGWGYYGCWTDYGRRKLAGPSYVDVANMTQESCIAFCDGNSHPYAGVEYGHECYCGQVIGAESERKADYECDFSCPGAAGQACGSNNRLNVFYTELLDFTDTNAGPSGTSRIGCYTDDVYARAMSVFQASEDGMTVAQCTSSCKASGHGLAGLEYGRECFCGDSLDNNSTESEEGCDMRCSGNLTEFCGGIARLEVYTLNVNATPDPVSTTSVAPESTSTASATPDLTSTSSATPTCRPTAVTTGEPYIVNGGFEQGVANWTGAAYDPDLYPFDVGLTDDAFEGCLALKAVPKSTTALSQHVQLSATLINLEVAQSYTIDLSIGHREIVDSEDAISDPKYTIRLSDNLLGRGEVCGFATEPCLLTGLNNSTWTTLSYLFEAESTNETLTVYLSWYNGNLDVPLYLDNVIVRPSLVDANDPDDFDDTEDFSGNNGLWSLTSRVIGQDPLPTRVIPPASGIDLSRTETRPTIDAEIREIRDESSSAPTIPSAESSISSLLSAPSSHACQRPPPKVTRWSDPPLELTIKSVSNHGFENGLRDWDFSSKEGTFNITLTNQSLEGCLAASIQPTTAHNGTNRAITLQTRLTNLNASNEWYAVQFYVGHADYSNSTRNLTSPYISMSYQSPISSDIERSVSLCGFSSVPRFLAAPRACELRGAENSQWQAYGMDVRLFHGNDGRFTNETEMTVQLEIEWPRGAADVPIYVDGVRVWEIEWGTISR